MFNKAKNQFCPKCNEASVIINQLAMFYQNHT